MQKCTWPGGCRRTAQLSSAVPRSLANGGRLCGARYPFELIWDHGLRRAGAPPAREKGRDGCQVPLPGHMTKLLQIRNGVAHPPSLPWLGPLSAQAQDAEVASTAQSIMFSRGVEGSWHVRME